MGDHIKGSVGNVHPSAKWRQGKAPGNATSDQHVIIGLLSKIASSKGGKKEDWAGNSPPVGGDGLCLKPLADAIWDFQSHWKAAGVFKNIDGIVDPVGNTIRVLNTLVFQDTVKPTGPNAQLPANTTNLNKLIEGLRSLFPRPSRWTLTNAPGINIGFEVVVGIGVGAGQLDVKEDGAAQERHLTYASGGAGMGWGPAGPVTFTASTRDMKSATSIKRLAEMGRIFSRVPNLSVEDMTGTCCILGMSGAAPTKFYADVADAAGVAPPLMGASFSLYMLGIQPGGKEALMRLPTVGHLHTGVLNAMKDVKAICMSAGEVMGFDLSVGMQFGLVTDYFGKITVPQSVIDRQNEAKGVFDQGKKTVTDTLGKAADSVMQNFDNLMKDWGRN